MSGCKLFNNENFKHPLQVIYKYVLKTQETSKFKYVDFEDCVHIFHNFIPKEIALVFMILLKASKR